MDDNQKAPGPSLLKAILYLVLFFTAVYIFFSMVDVASNFLDSLPWFLLIPVNILIVVVVYRAFNRGND